MCKKVFLALIGTLFMFSVVTANAQVNIGLLGTAGTDGLDMTLWPNQTTDNLNDGVHSASDLDGIHLDAGEPGRAYITFSTPVLVDSVTVYHYSWQPANYATTDFQIQTLNIGGSPTTDADWVDRATVTGNTSAVTTHNFLTTLTSGVRIYITNANATDTYGRIEELEVYGTEGASILGSVINAKSFGAKGDGVINDTTAMQSAINYAVKNGLRLKIPTGKYILDNLTIPNYVSTPVDNVNIFIEGDGAPNLLGDGNTDLNERGGTILKFTKTDGTHFITFTTVTGGSFPALSIHNLELRGPGAGSGDGLRVFANAGAGASTVRVDFENLDVNNFRSGNGIYLYFCENGSGRNVSVSRNNIGLYLINATNANNWYNVVAEYNYTNGIKIYDCTTNAFFGGLIQHNDKNGIYLNGVNETSFYNIHFEGNNVTSPNTYHAFHIEGTANMYNGCITVATSRFAGQTDTVRMNGVSNGNVANIMFLNCRSFVNSTSVTLADTSVSSIRFLGGFGGTIVDNGINNELPEWKAWTPTFTGASLSGYDIARYKIVGKICYIQFTATSKNVTSAGLITISLPTTISPSSGYAVFDNNVINAGTSWRRVLAQSPGGATTLSIPKTATGGNWSGNETGVNIRLSGYFEVQ